MKQALVAIVLTTACNLRCSYCLLQPGRRRSLAWPVLEAALDALLANGRGRVEILFTGGEPLLALPTIERAVSHLESVHAARCPLDLAIVTNGTLLDDRAAAFLDDHGFTVNLSFDGVAAAQALRGTGTFEALDQLVDRLRTSRPSLFARTRIAMTLAPPTVRWLADSVAYFLSKGVPTVMLQPAVGRLDWELDRIHELDRAFDEVSRLSTTHYELTGAVPLTLFRKLVPDQQPRPGTWICGASRGRGVTIDADGLGYGCVMAAASFQPHPCTVLREAVESLALGPVDSGLETRVAHMSARARASGAYEHPDRRYSRYRPCAGCPFVGRCYACPLAAASDPGWDDVRRVPDFLCAFNQVALAHRDSFPCQARV